MRTNYPAKFAKILTLIFIVAIFAIFFLALHAQRTIIVHMKPWRKLLSLRKFRWIIGDLWSYAKRSVRVATHVFWIYLVLKMNGIEVVCDATSHQQQKSV